MTANPQLPFSAELEACCRQVEQEARLWVGKKRGGEARAMGVRLDVRNAMRDAMLGKGKGDTASESGAAGVVGDTDISTSSSKSKSAGPVVVVRADSVMEVVVRVLLGRWERMRGHMTAMFDQALWEHKCQPRSPQKAQTRTRGTPSAANNTHPALPVARFTQLLTDCGCVYKYAGDENSGNSQQQQQQQQQCWEREERWVAAVYRMAASPTPGEPEAEGQEMTADSFVRACLECGAVRLRALPQSLATPNAAGAVGPIVLEQAGLGDVAGVLGGTISPTLPVYALPPPATPPSAHTPLPPPQLLHAHLTQALGQTRPQSVEAAMVLEQLSGVTPAAGGALPPSRPGTRGQL